MIRILRDRKVGKQKENSVNQMKEIAKGERDKILSQKIQEIVSEEMKNTGIHGRLDEINKKINRLDSRLEEFKKTFVPFTRVKEDGVRKMKIKRMISELLRKHRKLTANDLAVMLNLSRTRCSEYLSEMEKDEVTRGVLVRRQKFYEMVER